MNEKPSYLSSTLSQLLVVSVLAYGIACSILVWQGKSGIEPVKWLIEILLPLYGVKRGVEAAKNHPAEVKP